MNALKSTISVLLLIVYAMGLAHGLTPRCNHYTEATGSNTIQIGHHHEHHEHGDEETVDHGHIEHNGHLDEGAIDLLICVLEDVTHSDNGEEGCHCVPTISSRTSADWVSKLKMMAVAVSFVSYVRLEPSEPFFDVERSTDEIRSAHLTGLGLRGPPSIS
jgi:hypothetical protein